jgi:hypothetical protein
MSKAELLNRLKKALAGGRLDFDDVVAKARTGEVQFHEVDSAVGVTSIGVSGPFKTCYVLAVAGRLSAVPALNAKVEEYAKASGCQVIEMQGRPGWSRVHSKVADGYGPSTVIFRKSLEITSHGRVTATGNHHANPESRIAGLGG